METIQATIERLVQGVEVSYGFSPSILAILQGTDEIMLVVEEFWALFTYNILTQEFDVSWDAFHNKQLAQKFGVC